MTRCDRVFAFGIKLARAAASLFAFMMIYAHACSAQSFSVPGRVMRQEAAPPQQTALPTLPSPPTTNPNHTSIWGPLFKAQVERCWKKPAADGRGVMEAIFAIKLKRDGMVDIVHVVSGIDTTSYGRAYQTSSFRAIMECQPYRLPDAYYDEWRYFEPVFTERRR
jgi:hypothetical protein